jgi:predicted nucleotidyltransferase
LRDLESEFGESTNSIRVELNRLEEAGMLSAETSGNKKLYRANTKHPLFADIHSLLLKHTGIDHVIERVVSKLGGLDSAYLTGSFAKGLDGPVIDILMVGNEVDRVFLLKLIEKAEALIHRKIRYVIVTPEEKPGHLKNCPEAFLLWEHNK